MPRGVFEHKPQQGFQKGHISFRTSENRRKQSETMKGKKPKNLELLHKLPRTEGWKRKISQSNKGRVNPWFFGDRNPNWNGGVSSLCRYKHYNNAKYKNWREEVFQRDDWTCQICEAKGGFLHPHHIKSYTHFPALRYRVGNGLTLCVPCHHTTYGWGC